MAPDWTQLNKFRSLAKSAVDATSEAINKGLEKVGLSGYGDHASSRNKRGEQRIERLDAQVNRRAPQDLPTSVSSSSNKSPVEDGWKNVGMSGYGNHISSQNKRGEQRVEAIDELANKQVPPAPAPRQKTTPARAQRDTDKTPTPRSTKGPFSSRGFGRSRVAFTSRQKLKQTKFPKKLSRRRPTRKKTGGGGSISFKIKFSEDWIDKTWTPDSAFYVRWKAINDEELPPGDPTPEPLTEDELRDELSAALRQIDRASEVEQDEYTESAEERIFTLRARIEQLDDEEAELSRTAPDEARQFRRQAEQLREDEQALIRETVAERNRIAERNREQKAETRAEMRAEYNAQVDRKDTRIEDLTAGLEEEISKEFAGAPYSIKELTFDN